MKETCQMVILAALGQPFNCFFVSIAGLRRPGVWRCETRITEQQLPHVNNGRAGLVLVILVRRANE